MKLFVPKLKKNYFPKAQINIRETYQ